VVEDGCLELSFYSSIFRQVEAPPGLRLPRTFCGHIEIDGELASPSRVVWLTTGCGASRDTTGAC
jgi:hypothetical protein